MTSISEGRSGICLGDAWACFGVALSGLVILFTHWILMDPLISFVVAAIPKGVWLVLKTSLGVLMETAPSGMTTSDVSEAIKAVPGVHGVHAMHQPGMTMLTCHVMSEDKGLSQDLLTSVRRQVSKNCRIAFMTIQLEASSHPEANHCDLDGPMSSHSVESQASLNKKRERMTRHLFPWYQFASRPVPRFR